MLRDKIHKLLNFCSPAAVPTEWNVQLVTVGKTVHNGLGISVLAIWSYMRYFTTWVPYFMNLPSKKKSVIYIFTMSTTRFSTSHIKNCIKYPLLWCRILWKYAAYFLAMSSFTKLPFSTSFSKSPFKITTCLASFPNDSINPPSHVFQ